MRPPETIERGFNDPISLIIPIKVNGNPWEKARTTGSNWVIFYKSHDNQEIPELRRKYYIYVTTTNSNWLIFKVRWQLILIVDSIESHMTNLQSLSNRVKCII